MCQFKMEKNIIIIFFLDRMHSQDIDTNEYISPGPIIPDGYVSNVSCSRQCSEYLWLQTLTKRLLFES